MSFMDIVSSLFGGSSASAAPDATKTDPNAVQSTDGGSTDGTEAAASSGGTPTVQPVDIAQLLRDRAATHPGLNYETSIVDLLKLLDLPHDLGYRKALAADLNYDGNTEDTATMNEWLHREVMTKLADDGGIVPDDWKHPA